MLAAKYRLSIVNNRLPNDLLDAMYTHFLSHADTHY